MFFGSYVVRRHVRARASERARLCVYTPTPTVFSLYTTRERAPIVRVFIIVPLAFLSGRTLFIAFYSLGAALFIYADK